MRPKLFESMDILVLLLSFSPRSSSALRLASLVRVAILVRPLQAIEGELAVDVVDFHPAALGKLALEKLRGQGILDPLLDHALQRPGAVGGVVALGGDGVQGGGGNIQLDAPPVKLPFQPLDLQLHDAVDLPALQGMEDQHLVDAIEKLGQEARVQGVVDRLANLLLAAALAG